MNRSPALQERAVGSYGRGSFSPDAALVAEHLELVRRIAHHLAARLPASVDIEDLMQAGTIGLIEAARHYSGDRGARFETYAGIRIRGAMVDELRRGDWAPRSVHRRMREVTAAIRAIEQDSGREARESEIVERLGIGLSEYHEIVSDAVQCQVLSIDTPRGGDDDDAPGYDAPSTAPTPAESVERAAFGAALAQAIAALPEREKLVMALYYDEELNLREIGEVLEVTESRVCQLHGQALLRLRARLGGWRDAAADPAPQRQRGRMRPALPATPPPPHTR